MDQPNHFPDSNVYGLTGRVFGKHPHQKRGNKVPTDHGDWRYDVRIRWPDEWDKRLCLRRPDQPVIHAHDMHWAMFNSNLEKVEANLGFSIRSHCRKLCAETVGRKPAILEWGCGMGNALKDLAQDPEIRKGALVYGYGDVWDADWNDVEGVKFLFFVKEHLIEYFRRTRRKIDFVYSHGAMEYLKGDEFPNYLEALGSLMDPGAKIAFPTSVIRREVLWELKSFLPPCEEPQTSESGIPCMLTRK